MINISQAVAKRILELCKERNITVNKLSTISAVTQSTVSDIVNNRAKNIGIVTIKNFVTDLKSLSVAFLTHRISGIWNRKYVES